MKQQNKKKFSQDGHSLRRNQKVQKEPIQQNATANLDRFAGSSEDEDEYDKDYRRSHHNIHKNKVQFDEPQKEDSDESAESSSQDHEEEESGDVAHDETAFLSLDSDVEEDDSKGKEEEENVYNEKSDEESSSEFDEYDHGVSKKEGRGQTGMADAMSRILGVGASTHRLPKAGKSTVNNIVLSKTITPLQKRRRQEKEEEEELRKKQKQRRVRNLTAMHTPISCLTMGSNGNELELERGYKRVATRGVVALFNAITQHQHQKKQQAVITPTNGKNSPAQPLTKYGFLEKIKNSAQPSGASAMLHESTMVTQDEHATVEHQSYLKTNRIEEPHRNKDAKNKTKGWNALKDDFMMNTKLKDWDKELSDNDYDDNDNSFDDEHYGGGDDDDFMDDD
jgi:hypothetical protein